MLLHLDWETRSEVDLSVVGLYNYVSHPTTRAILLAYAVDDAAPRICRPDEDGLPPELVDLIRSPHVIKSAWHSSFEQAILKHVFKIWVPYEQWEDPMVRARYCSMPGGLDDVGRILGLAADIQKLEEGKKLVKMFCEPAVEGGHDTFFGPAPSGFRTRETHPAEWAQFEVYCKRDLIAERAVLHKLAKFELPERERLVWYLDRKINSVGMPTDLELVVGAGKVADAAVAELHAKLKELTKLENPNSTEQMLGFIQTQGYDFGSLGKAFVNRALNGECELTDLGREVLTIRQQAAKTSHHKLTAIRDIVSPDSRLRDQFSYLGAARTGRWSGHNVQLQNLRRPIKEFEKNLESAISLLQAGDYASIRSQFSAPLDVVGSCLRSCFKAPPGKRFVVCDLSAIENRVLGWVSRCEDILDVFRQGRDPYLSFAVDLNGIPYEQMVDANGECLPEYKEVRQNAKPAVLGAGYQLSGGEEVENEDGDIIKTGLWGYAAAMGITLAREQAHNSVAVWRRKYKQVVQCWYDLERAALSAFRTHETQECGRCLFECKSKKLLRVILPSGRALHYIRPEIETQTFTTRDGQERQKDGLTFEGLEQVKRVWTRIRTHGGKWMENIVQALARDLLAEALLEADRVGFEIAGHCHDEIISLTDEGSSLGIVDLRSCMIRNPEWAPDLPLDAAGYEDQRYRKG